jgi:hypothetical protein
LRQLTFFVFPEGATQPTLAAGTGELVYVHTDATSGGVVSLISDRDGVLFTSPPVPGTNFGVYPDLSPNGRLVFLGVEHADGTGPFHAWVGIRDNNGQECTYTGFTCDTDNDTTPPVVTITATPETLRPPNGKMVPVTITGTITEEGSGVDPSTATYAVIDEYKLVQPQGSFIPAANGSYAFDIQLQASRQGNDKDGRQYTITVTVKDKAGNTGSAATRVIVPHDQRQ